MSSSKHGKYKLEINELRTSTPHFYSNFLLRTTENCSGVIVPEQQEEKLFGERQRPHGLSKAWGGFRASDIPPHQRKKNKRHFSFYCPRGKSNQKEQVIKTEMPPPDIRLGLAGPISWSPRARALMPPGWEGRRLGIWPGRPKVIKNWKSNEKLKCLRQT